MIKLITGPMFASKSKSLIRDITEARQDPHSRVLVFQPSIDTRSGFGKIRTHDGEEVAAIVVAHPTEILTSFDTPPTLVVIDEVQFFEENVIKDVILKLQAQGINVICCGLSLCSEGGVFLATALLSAIADVHEIRRARCDYCGNPAEYNYFKGESKGVVKIGGVELYGAECHKCRTKK